MQGIEYITVFQISRQTDWLIALASAVPLVIGIVLVIGKRRFRWRRPSWLFLVYFCIFGVFCAWIVSRSVFGEGASAPFSAYQAGNYSIVEGVVTDFHPMPYGGHDYECFSVRSQRFCYSDYVTTPGFHNAASHGGPIRAGLPVRIAHLGDMILRLDVAKDQAISPSESKEALESAKKQFEIGMERNLNLQRIMTAALFTAVCWTLWANLQWRWAMRIWVRRPNPPIVQRGFRVLFAVSLIGACVDFVQQLRRHPLTGQNLGATMATAAIMCCVVGSVTAVVLLQRKRRERKQIRGEFS